MPAPPELEDFDQTERHTARLRDLVDRYPKGLGIIKEFLQNADDAGASFLHVTYDRRRHPGSMDNAEQEVVLGPALLLANDRTFTKKDLQNIQHIGGGGKLHEARGTGRFGYGFNTCFGVSDHPTLLTGDKIVWFDPHQRAHGSRRNAWAWSLENVNQSWPAWAATFAPGGHVPGSARFDGTLFRLPVRTPEEARRSEILAEAFTDDNFEKIIDDAQQAGPALLVFLRSVQTLRIDEIMPNGTRQTRFCIETLNCAEVEAQRAQVRDAVSGEPAVLLDQWLQSDEALPMATYRHTFRVSIDGQSKERTWMVVTGLFPGPDDQLLQHARTVCDHNEKALPWAGAAAPIDNDAFPGGLVCFLPLPEPVAWPILLHGWFALDSGRRDLIRQAEASEKELIRTNWNTELLRHGVGPAWAMLIEQLREDAAKTTDPYRLWPHPSTAKDAHDRALVEGFYAEIGARPVFRCRDSKGHAWCSLAEADQTCWNLGEQWHDVLRDPLLADGDVLLEPPLPVFAVEELKKTSHPVQVLSAKRLRGIMTELSQGLDINCALQDAPWMSLGRREWVIALARFCAQDGLEKLTGLSLALLADGKLHTFGSCGAIYLVTEAEKALLAKVPHRMLDPQFEQDLVLSKPVPALGIKKLDVPGLVECVREILSAGPPDEAWLIRLFDHLEQLTPAEVKRHRETLQNLSLVPDDKGQRWQMVYPHTPVLLDQTSTGLRGPLVRLGIPIVEASPELLRAIRSFATRHSGFVGTLSPDHLATALASHVETPWMHEQALTDRTVQTAVLNYLSPLSWVRQNDSRIAALRRLPMLPTTDGSVVAAETKDLYVPGDFAPPHGFGVKQKLLEIGNRGHWKALYQALGVAELDGFAFVFDLVPTFQHAAPDARLQMLRWLRDHLVGIEQALSPERRKSLRNKVHVTAILPVRGGGLRAPRDLYRPDAKATLVLLGDVARVPDLGLLGDDPARWNQFFIDLGLHSSPQPDDLLEAIQQCADLSRTQGIEAVRARLDALRGYVGEHWNSLGDPNKGGTKKFAQALAAMAWLPAAAPSEKVACAARWENRLYKASELVAPALLHLVASVHPVLDGSPFPSDMEKALGLRTMVSNDEVLRHFEGVRASGIKGPTTEAHKKTLVAFLQHIGQPSETTKREWAPRLAALSDQPCVLLRGVWWRPKRVFLESLTFETDWCASLLEDRALADLPRIKDGLDLLGARLKPTPSDWVEMLHEQQSKAAGRPLTESELAQVRGALQQLRVEDREWLRSRPVRVPTADGHLLLAKDSFLPDDPRLKRTKPLCSLPLVEETEVSLEVARATGARSLLKTLVDELSEEPTPSEDSNLLRWAEERTQAMRSPLFYEALRRLAWHEATIRGEDVDEEKLTLAKRITLHVVRALRVTSSLPDTGEVVFEQQANSFWDKTSANLWLSAGGKRKMGDELARTLATECGLDALRLSRLLDGDAEDMASLLDEDNIATIPEGVEGALPPRWVEPEHLSNQPALSAPDDEPANSVEQWNDEAERNWPPTEKEASDPTISEWKNNMPTGIGMPSMFSPSSSRDYGNGGAGGARPRVGASSGSMRHARAPLPQSQPLMPPTTPGFGSSNPWTPDAPPRPKDGTRRLRSYVHREEQNDYDTSSSGPNPSGPVDQAALQRAIQWEQARGRTPIEAPDGYLGYDLESSGPEGARYIKVRGIDGPWTARGVGVTGPNQRKALELGTQWWLYVVEHAQDPNRTVVHELRNPFLDATEYRFDSGWRPSNVTEEAQAKDPVEGEVITLEDGRTATVVEAERRGQLWEVVLQFSDGHEEERIWQPTWRQN